MKHRPWIWQQDGASCHTSKRTLNFIDSENVNYVPQSSWSHNSQELNHLYFLSGVLLNRFSMKVLQYGKITGSRDREGIPVFAQWDAHKGSSTFPWTL
uniref:Uncharacterized protein n=1 Tax=Lepeophtheirus salmonis TaxID=72036 RepID=A0A0K2TG49_LEPSM